MQPLFPNLFNFITFNDSILSLNYNFDIALYLTNLKLGREMGAMKYICNFFLPDLMIHQESSLQINFILTPLLMMYEF